MELAGHVVDVTLMTRLGVNAKGTVALVDSGSQDEVEDRYARFRATSDAAQVVAAYLSCHPKVEAVRYPGLKDDPSFQIAARTLVGGFGPFVDYCVDGTWHRFEATVADAKAQVMDLERALGDLS